jgi:hypothetical protein
VLRVELVEVTFKRFNRCFFVDLALAIVPHGIGGLFFCGIMTLLDLLLVKTGECLFLYGFRVGAGGVESCDEGIYVEFAFLRLLVVFGFFVFSGLCLVRRFLVFFGFGGVLFLSDAPERGFARRLGLLPGANGQRWKHIAGF